MAAQQMLNVEHAGYNLSRSSSRNFLLVLSLSERGRDPPARSACESCPSRDLNRLYSSRPPLVAAVKAAHLVDRDDLPELKPVDRARLECILRERQMSA